MDQNDSCNNCTIDDFKKMAYPTIYISVFILGSFGNGLSIYVFLQPYKKKTSVNVFMLNLAISDFLFVWTLPLRATYYLMNSSWVFGDLGCRILSYALYVNMYSSIYFLTVLSIVRFVAIVHPFKHWKLTTIKYSRIICGVIWGFVMICASRLLFLKAKDINKCLDLQEGSSEKIRELNYIVLVVGFILPFCTIIVCYVLVIKALLKPRVPQAKIRAPHKKAVSTIVITLSLFLICFLPYHILRTIYLQEWRKDNTFQGCNFLLHKGAVITLCLAAMNSCLDPILYYFAGENFKERFKNVYIKCSRCRNK
uniref:Cysteinyl leukotriene receptor 2 n=1 Tax=Pelodiscus sinensis TaxID=13735 RepID=K7F0H4_PELSI|nr:cysteinyl leukotriene receptor 2 [Pelodiscus sinensis]XP_025042930.1 cysteinyl leukotriene receptor 2 [Pelodiscus sinensis]XP_025042931.1 cysteinyl leukotriene receptor 2 [Pelodiscus sinensis]|eukprot:XP_006128000.1 cysteinyl leukotriene receptor 2 [Pelodiscus sinensis]